MALPNSNISVSMVKSELRAATNNVGQLCIHPNVNKWSKRKPVRWDALTGITNGNPTLGADVPETMNAIILSRRNDQWTYLPPRGGYTEPYRLEDFREYDHTAKFSDAPFGVGDIAEAGSNTIITLLYGGGSGSEFVHTPKNMPFFQNMYGGIQIFGANQINLIMDEDHLYSYCAATPISSATSYAFSVPTSLFSGKKIVLVIPFISASPFTSSSGGAGGSIKYVINGYAPQNTSKMFFPNGEPELLYIPSMWAFERESSYSFYVDFDLVSQWIIDVFLYDTRLQVEFWSGKDATGTKVYEMMETDAPRLDQVNIPPLDRLHQRIQVAWGGPHQSVRLILKDRYRNKTYDPRVFNV